jgi:hypothetical protein
MIAIAFLFVHMAWDCFKSRRRLEAEILVLRHQLNVLQQRAPRRLHLRWVDRALFIWLYRRCPRIPDAITIVRPETIVRWHRMGFAGRRQLLWIAVTRNPTAEWLAHQITEAFPWDRAPKYLIRDNDRAFGIAFKARVRAMGIRDRPTAFRSPWQNCFPERLIGSIRRECTDHLIVSTPSTFGEFFQSTPPIIKYATYYNEVRTHLALRQGCPPGSDSAAFRCHRRHPELGWAAPPLCPDIIFGRDSVIVRRDPARQGGVEVTITGRLNAVLGEKAYPNGVCGALVAGAGIEPATYGL